jgi:hypothetical protein
MPSDRPLETQSIPELFSSAVHELATLVRKESELVRTEVKENVQAAGRASVWIGLGAALMLGAFLALVAFVILALSVVIAPLWATLIVGLALGLAGWLVLQKAIARLKPAALAPDRAARQLREDVNLIKEQAS